MLSKIAHFLIRRSESRIGVKFDYIHKMADTRLSLLARYNRLFGLVDPNKHCPPAAYHTARLRGALAADCGTCVEAEINLASSAGLDTKLIRDVLRGNPLPAPLDSVATLTDSVTKDRTDNPEAREKIIAAYGDAGLIELSLAMNAAAMMPGVKRAMGYATACDLNTMRKLAP